MIPMTVGEIAVAAGAELVLPARPSSGVVRSNENAATGQNLSITRVVIDSREVRPGDLFVAIRGHRLDGHSFLDAACENGASACVCDRQWFDSVSPRGGTEASSNDAGVQTPFLVVSDTVEMLGRLAAHYRREVMRPSTVVIAITGSNGKTTTKAMLDHLLRSSFKGHAAPGSFNNAIGVPLTLLSADSDDRYLIVEIGSNTEGEVDALARITGPSAAVITSIGAAHLEGLTNLDGIASEKAALLDHVRADGLAVVNVDQPEMRRQLAMRRHRFRTDTKDSNPSADGTGTRVVTIGTGNEAKLRVSIIESSVRETTFELEDRFRATVPMPGKHHAINAAAALVIARWFGLPPEEIAQRLRSFTPLDGRTRLIELGDIVLIDDAYNANPASMTAAVETLGAVTNARRIFVMGDMLELGGASEMLHERIVDSVLGAGIEVLVAVGDRTIEATRKRDLTDERTRVVVCQDAKSATSKVASLLQANDVVWVKGSRGIELDRVVRHLCARVAMQTAVA